MWNGTSWINAEILSKYQNFFVYGDSGGDSFVKTPETVEEVRVLTENHAKGITDCGFETRIYLIACNGKQMKIKVSLEEV